MERRAEIRARHLRPAHDEIAFAEAAALVFVEPFEIALAVRRQQNEAVGPDDPSELVHPVVLDRLRQVREHRERVREIERPVVERQRWREAVRLEASEGKIVAAPVDRGAGEVTACDARLQPRPVADHATAAAAKVEDRIHRVDPRSGTLERVADRLRREAAALEEPRRVWRPRDARDHVCRRHRQAIRRRGLRRRRQVRGPRTLVGPVRGPEQAYAAEQPQERRLHRRNASARGVH
jgi:hypothetical protein